MTKRLYRAEQVLDALLSDDEDFDLDDPDEPIMEGSDDEFSDMELASDDEYEQEGENEGSPSSPQPPDHFGMSTLSSLSPSPQSSPSPSVPTSPTPPCAPVWTNTLNPVTIQPFTSPVGPTVPIPESPVDVFDLFFTDDILQKTVEESNRYAQQVMGQEKYDNWRKITIPELRAHMGFSILMGVNKLPEIEDYWKKDPHLHYGPIADRITRDRFRDISRYLHFVDNSTLVPRGSPGHDRLGKVRPMIDHLSSKFASTYTPHCETAVDEAMIKFQGRSSLKQYMPMKPVKRGIKVWVLGDSHNGYFSRFDIYTGKGASPEKGLGARVVKSLTEPLKNKFHHVYFDNFFTSEQLLTDLEKDGIYGCGTARKDRRGFPDALKKPKLKERYIHKHCYTKQS